jgi:outer membrane assembly lipoprotein YfgL
MRRAPLLLSLVDVLLALALAALAVLSGCASNDKPKPVALEANPAQLGVNEVWRATVGATALPLEVRVVGSQVLVASTQGDITAFEARSGQAVWRASVGAPLSAGVGSDGQTVALVTRENQLIALRDGKEVWRQKLPSLTLTSPLVAGARVFLLSADRTVAAFDAATGRRLWLQQRPGDALVLGQPGILMAVGDTLLSTQSGRLLGLNPQNGAVRWDAPVAVGRGVNEVERLVDLVSGTSRVGNNVCLRAFQSAVACVDAQAGRTLWTKPASGASGVAGDANAIFGADGDGKVLAWNRADGEKLWTSEKLRFRGLSAPVIAGRALAVGDFEGFVHFLSPKDGALLARVASDGTPIALAPVWVGETLVVVTQRGSVIGFRPE